MDDLKDEIESNNKVWDQPGRPPRALAEKVKQETAEKKAIRVKKSRKGGVLVQQDDKMELFLQEFLKNDGNATAAALAVFNCTTIESASTIGSRYLKKAKDLGLVRTILEKKGYGQGKMMEVAIQKMLESKTPEWWDRLMKMADYEDFITKKEVKTGGQTINILNAQRDISRQFGFDEEEVVDAEEVGDE